MLFELTARHKHITWSVSCSMSDYGGHTSTSHGYSPHYHFQMLLDGKPFINFSDYHIPFHPDDLFDIKLFLENSDIAKRDHGPGIGLDDIFSNKDALNVLVENSQAVFDENKATLNLSTIVMAQPGKTISGEELYKVFQEAKATGKTITSVARKTLKDVSISTMVTAGDGLPEAKIRKPRSRR